MLRDNEDPQDYLDRGLTALFRLGCKADDKAVLERIAIASSSGEVDEASLIAEYKRVIPDYEIKLNDIKNSEYVKIAIAQMKWPVRTKETFLQEIDVIIGEQGNLQNFFQHEHPLRQLKKVILGQQSNLTIPCIGLLRQKHRRLLRKYEKLFGEIWLVRSIKNKIP